MSHSEAFIEGARKAVELAAIARFRCPMNGDGSVNSNTLMILCLRGEIRVEISGYNYRTAIMLKGPHRGASTAPDPKGMLTWRVVDTRGAYRVRRRWHEVARRENNFAAGQSAAAD